MERFELIKKDRLYRDGLVHKIGFIEVYYTNERFF